MGEVPSAPSCFSLNPLEPSSAVWKFAGVLSDSALEYTYDGVFNSGNNLAVNGVLSLVKAAAGTWILSGTNTYTGMTTISAGTLVANEVPSAFVGMMSLALNTATDCGSNRWTRRSRFKLNKATGSGTAFIVSKCAAVQIGIPN